MTIQDIENKEKDKTIIIIGAGSTLRQYKNKLLNLIQTQNTPTIGINNMTQITTPTYHLWTNTSRYLEYGHNINKQSTIIIGQNIKDKNIKHKHIKLPYEDKPNTPIQYKNGKIYGHFRTAGCLAIILAKILGAKQILIAGMDGYTLHNQQQLKNNSQSQHLYGQGQTDKATWEECIQKDQIVTKTLQEISKTINFKIITPTKFTNHYNGEYL